MRRSQRGRFSRGPRAERAPAPPVHPAPGKAGWPVHRSHLTSSLRGHPRASPRAAARPRPRPARTGSQPDSIRLSTRDWEAGRQHVVRALAGRGCSSGWPGDDRRHQGRRGRLPCSPRGHSQPAGTLGRVGAARRNKPRPGVTGAGTRPRPGEPVVPDPVPPRSAPADVAQRGISSRARLRGTRHGGAGRVGFPLAVSRSGIAATDYDRVRRADGTDPIARGRGGPAALAVGLRDRPRLRGRAAWRRCSRKSYGTSVRSLGDE